MERFRQHENKEGSEGASQHQAQMERRAWPGMKRRGRWSLTGSLPCALLCILSLGSGLNPLQAERCSGRRLMHVARPPSLSIFSHLAAAPPHEHLPRAQLCFQVRSNATVSLQSLPAPPGFPNSCPVFIWSPVGKNVNLIFIMGRESFKAQATFMEDTLWGKAEAFCVPAPALDHWKPHTLMHTHVRMANKQGPASTQAPWET